MVQEDGSIGTEAAVTLNAATGLTVIGGMVEPIVTSIVSSIVSNTVN